MKRTLRSRRLRRWLFNHYEGKCAICRAELGDDWHADHIVPWSVSKRTNVFEMQALCPACNLRKGAMMFEPRVFQTDILKMVEAEPNRKQWTFHIECGCGKSILIGAIAYTLYKLGVTKSALWVAPRVNLCTQAIGVFRASSPMWSGFGVDPGYAKNFELKSLTPPEDSLNTSYFAYATTCQSIQSDQAKFLQWIEARPGKAVIFVDEPQLIAEGSPSERALIPLIQHPKVISVFLSGDLERDDRSERVAFIDYDINALGQTVPQVDYSFGIKKAKQAGYILEPEFIFGDGPVEYKRQGSGFEVEHRYDSLDVSEDQSGSLRAALVGELGEGLALECLRHFLSHRGRVKDKIRAGIDERYLKHHVGAQAMFVAKDKAHARAIQKLIVSNGVSDYDARVITSDEGAQANTLLKEFREGRFPIAVVVGMAYIGTDVPQLTHICCLTTYRTKGWLHQMIARVWRKPAGKDECFVFAPRDKQFRDAVQKICEEFDIVVTDPREGPGGDGEGAPPIAEVIPISSALESLWGLDGLQIPSVAEQIRHDLRAELMLLSERYGVDLSVVHTVAASISQPASSPEPVSDETRAEREERARREVSEIVRGVCGVEKNKGSLAWRAASVGQNAYGMLWSELFTAVGSANRQHWTVEQCDVAKAAMDSARAAVHRKVLDLSMRRARSR